MPTETTSGRVGLGFWARFWEFTALLSRSYSRQMAKLPWKKLFYFAMGCVCAMTMFALIQNARSRRNQYPFMIKGMKLNQGHPFMVKVNPEFQENQQQPQEQQPQTTKRGGDSGRASGSRSRSKKSRSSAGTGSKKSSSPRSGSKSH